jgi:nucleotidyltransferase/DNA polymerase involved in DNA repair
VGSLHPRKNLAGLLAGFAAYRAQGGEADLVVVEPRFEAYREVSAQIRAVFRSMQGC